MGIKKFSTPINFVIFQVCWFACVLGAAYDIGWLGPLMVLFMAPLQVYLLTDNHGAEFYFVLICGVSGFILETILIASKVYIPLGAWQLTVCPPWMAALWFNFAMLVSISLRWLKGKYLLAAFLGGVAGPIAYWGGEKLDALVIHDVFTRGYLPLAAVWALVMPPLIYLHTRITGNAST